ETILTPRLAERLNLRTASPPDGQKSAWVDSIAVGRAVARKIPVMVFDPPQALPLRLDKGIDYHGLLGYTFLSRMVFRLDYCRRRIRFEPSGFSLRTMAENQMAHRIRFRLRNRLIEVEGRVNDEGPVCFVVDTGAAETLLLPRIAAALGIVAAPLPGYAGVRISKASTVSVGTAVARDVPVLVMDLPASGGDQADGILGYPFLSNFVVTVSYRDSLLILEPCSP
ncbi:MAG: aspartyl protease family protein, partial [Kiritimatiellia bacterium]